MIVRSKKFRIGVKIGLGWANYIRSNYLDLEKVQAWFLKNPNFRMAFIYEVSATGKEKRIYYIDRNNIKKTT